MPAATIELAAEELSRDRPRPALEHALAAWRVHRSPRLAHLVVRLSVLAARGLPPITGRERLAAARELVARRDACDLPRVVRVFFDLTLGQARQLLSALEGWPADPRALELGLEVFEAPPWITEKTTPPFFRALAAWM